MTFIVFSKYLFVNRVTDEKGYLFFPAKKRIIEFDSKMI